MKEYKNPGVTEQDLLAENRRLKHLLNKMSGLGLSTSSLSNSPTDSNHYLPISISQILISDQPFDQRIDAVLQYLGEFTDVSRVYIFEDILNGKACQNTYEWCNQGVASQKQLLQSIMYEDVPSWIEILERDGRITANNIFTQLPADLIPVLDSQNIKSLLVFPLLIGNQRFGFIGFDECSYHRQWLEVEMALLATASHLLGNAFQQNRAINQINNSLNIQKFLYRIASSLNNPEALEETMDSVAKEFIGTWNLSMVAIYHLENQNSDDLTLFSSAFRNGNGYAFPQKITITSFDSMPVFPQMVSTSINSAIAGCMGEDLTGYGFPGKNGKIIGTCSQNGINGVVVLIWNSEIKSCPVTAGVMETFSGLIARAFDHRITYRQNKEQHKQILEINRQLVEKESFLNSIITSAPVGVILVKNRVIQYVNDHVLISSNFSKEELLGKNISDMYVAGYEKPDEVKRFYKEIEETGISSIDTVLRRKDGTPLYYNIIGTPGPHFEEEKYVLLIGQDLTKIKQTETSLRESEERNKRILEATIDGIFIMSDPGKLEYVNHSGCELTGYSREELTKISLEQLFPEKQNLTDFLKIFNQLRRGKDYRGDTQLRHSNGSSLFVEIYGTTITLEQKTHYYFNIHDITRRKQNEAALMLSEKKFRSLSENLPDCVVRINKSGLVTYSNSLFINLFNLHQNEINGRNVFHIDELPRDISEQFRIALIDVFGKKKMVQLEFNVVKGHDSMTFDWSLSPELDLNGQCVSLLGIGRDITHRKKVEKELLLAKDRAEAADRLKSAFLANMSHEIRTPLNAIVGFSNLLSQTDPESGDRDEYISLINKSADSLMALINDIIDIAKIESGHLIISKKPVDVNQLILPIFKAYQKRVDHHFKGKVRINLAKPADADPIFVEADPARLLQVLNNLLDNAIKFIHEGFIELGYVYKDNQIRFYVKDTGIGIAPENQEMVFNAFRQEEETTSKKYGGTGLGLAISKKLIEAMGGEIHLNSEKGKGSEFYFYLDGIQLSTVPKPELPQKIKHESLAVINDDTPAPMAQIPNWSNRMLLLVDENSSVHLHLKKQLEKTRITVLSARSGSSARHLLLKRKDIDLVIMDYRLPDIKASELVKQLRNAGIQVPLMVQTIGESEHETKILKQAGFDAEIKKPALGGDLIQKISDLLTLSEVNQT